MEVQPRPLLEQASIRMQKVFTKTYIEISKKLRTSLDYNRNPEFSAISIYMLYKYLERHFEELNKNIENKVSDEIEFAYYLGFAMGLMSFYDSTGIEYTFESVMKEVPTMIDKTVLINVKDVTMKDLLQVTRNTEYSVKRFIQDVMTKHLNVKQMKNMGRTDLANLLVKELEGKKLQTAIEDNMIAIIDNAGRRWKVNTYIDMVVQTKAHQVYVQGLQDFAAQNNGNGDLARIPVNPTTVDACLNFEGLIISMTGATAGYRTYAELKATNLIFHPRCRHHPKPYWDVNQIPKDIMKAHNKISTKSDKILE